MLKAEQIKVIMLITPDHALDVLRTIHTEFEIFCQTHGAASETDTRVKVIDRILKEVCGWPESHLSREDHVERGFIDYTLTINNRAFVAVEAKKSGVAFTLPRSSNQKNYKISGTISTDANVNSAIRQVRGYCDDAGIRYGIATNGESWIIFRAIRENGSWREGNARVFHSISNIIDNFTEFWNLLSYDSISGGSLDEEFGQSRRVTRNLYRVGERLFNYDAHLGRNRLHAQLEPLIKTIFSDIANQEEIEILNRCYVHNENYKFIIEDINCAISDSIPDFLSKQGTEAITQGKRNAGNFGTAISKAVYKGSGELFLLLGGIGSGKTTFVKRYQRSSGVDILNDRVLWFHIDFLSAPLEPKEMEQYVWRGILDQLRTRYPDNKLETLSFLKKVFATDIKSRKETALRNFPEGSPQYEHRLSELLEGWQENLPIYVSGLLKHVKHQGNHLGVVLFVDNVDQLSPAYQTAIFLLAQRVTRVCGCVTIVALREESYYTANVQNTFTAYSNRKFHIASPRFLKVIDSRISYAIEFLKRSDSSSFSIYMLPSGIQIDVESMTIFLGIVKDSIFQSNKYIARFVDAICFGNMRAALQMFANFLTSGATDVDKMLRIYERGGAYYVAFHEFVKSIMLAERRYYKEEHSPIMNVFDCGAEKNSSHFTSLRILAILTRHRGESTPIGTGYVDLAKLVGAFEEVFDNEADFIRSINRLVTKQLVEVDSRSTESIVGASFVRLTASGWYYRRYLVSNFSYLDLVLQDTPLNDTNVEQELREGVSRVDNLSDREDQKIERMEARFRRLDVFLDYLRKEEERERDEFGLHSHSGDIAATITPKIIENFQKQRDWIQNRLRQNKERFEEGYYSKEDEDDTLELENLISTD